MSDTTKAELGYERAETEYKRGVRAAVLIIAGLCWLCVLASLSGCLTPAKLAEMAQRADTLSRGAKTDECAAAAKFAAERRAWVDRKKPTR